MAGIPTLTKALVLDHHDSIDEMCGAISDGNPVDWSLAETRELDPGQEASVRGLRDVEKVARFSRSLQRQQTPQSTSSNLKAPQPWGHLTLLELISTGKTGAIWRAWDAWLQREVALKFLLTEGRGDIDGSVLLEEARALARIRHPGVVAVYGIGEHDDRVGMWMELLVGSTLEAEIERRGPLPPREVAQIGLDLCRALEAVVAAGLVHRDIKPANIIRESNGRVVLTDFGLGRRVAVVPPEGLRSSGTPLFMAPEVLAGEAATPRSDLYALGVTLRWALTGRCPFRSQTIEELRTEVSKGPSVSLRTERPDAPGGLIHAIDRATATQADSRYSSASQLAHDLQPLVYDTAGTSAGPAGRRWMVPALAAGLLLLAALLLVPRLGERRTAHPARFLVEAPPQTMLQANAAMMAVSPDGRHLVFSAVDSTGTSRLWVRPLDSVEARPLEGTEGAMGPFWSPDGRQIAFFCDLKLKKVALSGGPPEVLCQAPDPRGGTWGKGAIVFAPVAAGPLCRISDEGGTVTEIIAPDSTRHETALRWPQFLPDGKRFLFVALPPRDGVFDVYAGSLSSRERRRVMHAGCAPICAGRDGFIVADNGRLMFQRVDERSLNPVGNPIALGLAPFSDVSVGQPLASASMNGVLVEPNQSLGNTRLVSLDRSGVNRAVLPVPEGRYERLFIAPDGNRLIAERRDSPTSVNLWMIDLRRGETRRFTQGSQSRIGGKPAWSPDGRRIAFSSNRGGRTNIYQRSTDAAAEESLLYASNEQFKEVDAWSPDGRYLVFEQADPVTGWDLWLLPMEGKREPIPYLRSRGNEFAASISPDGRWLAYSTDASGKYEIYMRSFPIPGVEHLISHEPGGATWSRGGRELLVNVVDRWICSVPVSTTPTPRLGAARRLFRRSPNALWLAPTPSGDGFLQSEPSAPTEPATILVDVDYLSRVSR